MYLIGEEEIAAVRRVIESGRLFRYLEGSETSHFEQEWAQFMGVAHAITVTSGTAALICGLVGLEVGPGDEVIVPGYTFMATALAVLAVGAVPIIAEVNESLTLDAADLEAKITPRTRVVIPVHMNGFPCDMETIMAVARRHGLSVLEDCAQAIGGSYQGRRLGAIGDAGAFSFNSSKIITCGEGGVLMTERREVHERAAIEHDGGCAFWSAGLAGQTPLFAGSNFRSNEILTAILRVQLGRLEGILAGLRAEKRRMREELACGRAFTLSPVHDLEGDCATTMGLLFETGPQAQAFVKLLADQGIPAGSPIHSGRHIYCHWEPVMNRVGAHHPARDPYRQSEVKYSPDMCPRTLSALERTAFLYPSPTRSPQDLERLIAGVKRAAGTAA